MTTTRRGFFGAVFGGVVAAVTPWPRTRETTTPLGRTWFLDATDYGPQRVYRTEWREPDDPLHGYAWGDDTPRVCFKIDKLEDR